MRPSFHNILMNMALLVAERSTCTRLKVGAVISSTDFRKVLAFGYNGNAAGLPNQCDVTGTNAVGGCGCIHGEANAIINCDASRSVERLVFCTDSPCPNCAKYLINLGGVRHVYYFRQYRILDSLNLLTYSGIKVTQYIPPQGNDPEIFIPYEGKDPYTK